MLCLLTRLLKLCPPRVGYCNLHVHVHCMQYTCTGYMYVFFLTSFTKVFLSLADNFIFEQTFSHDYSRAFGWRGFGNLKIVSQQSICMQQQVHQLNLWAGDARSYLHFSSWAPGDMHLYSSYAKNTNSKFSWKSCCSASMGAFLWIWLPQQKNKLTRISSNA